MQLIVSADEAGQRLDQFLASRLTTLSRSRIQRLIRSDQVHLDAGRAKPGLIVDAGLKVDVVIPALEPAAPEPEALPLAVLHDDPDIVVVNKPAGMVVHPAAGHRRGTLVNALLHHIGDLSGIGGVARPGIVHRLDRGTSGVMVIAKHDAAHQHLARQFHDRSVEKIYVALVWGTLAAGQRFEQPIGRDRHHRQKMSSRTLRARSAMTEIISVEHLGGVSLAHVRIGTGRTHQIRVHLSERGYPVVGDDVYGGVRARVPPALAALTRLERPFLHAERLSITHPATNTRLTFHAPLPQELAAVLDALRRTA
jgi:23S rRNA pseudouridine1911/1915/1917 synthase